MPEVRTETPSGENGTGSTAAQPRDSDDRRSTTAPASSDRAQTSTDGPAPEIVAPSAPVSGARSTSSIDRGRSRARRGGGRAAAGRGGGGGGGRGRGGPGGGGAAGRARC